VVNEYFRIMSDIESDIVLAALQVLSIPPFVLLPLLLCHTIQAIVLQFGEEIEGISGMIIQQLLATFETYSAAGEEDDEAAFGAAECLETITTVLEVIKENSTAVGAVEGMLTPLLMKIFSSDDMIEYIENGIQIISYLTFYPENINPVSD
jgi:importin-7